MKGCRTSPPFIFCLLLLASLISGITACKKSSSSSSKSPYDGKLSFTYNGTPHTLPFRDGVAEWGIEGSGIFINRPDLFNGIIHFPSPNCAYLDPNTNGSSLFLASGCQLTSGSGTAIDSVAVYLYQSGSATLTYKNCTQKSEYEPFTGRTVSYDICDANGTFNLVLKNKENKTITITNGVLEMYSLRR